MCSHIYLLHHKYSLPLSTCQDTRNHFLFLEEIQVQSIPSNAFICCYPGHSNQSSLTTHYSTKELDTFTDSTPSPKLTPNPSLKQLSLLGSLNPKSVTSSTNAKVINNRKRKDLPVSARYKLVKSYIDNKRNYKNTMDYLRSDDSNPLTDADKSKFF